MTTLELVNAVLRNCGESTVAALTSLTGFQLVVWDKLIEALVEICTDQNTRWQFLESFGRLALATGTSTYAISGFATGTDMQREDKKSLIQTDAEQNITYITPQEFDAKYPQGITTNRRGVPTEYTKFASKFLFNYQAGSNENGDYVDFRYWKHPTYPATATPNASLDIPEPFDRLVLVALATMKCLAYLGSDEAVAYKMMVYGDGRDVEGNFKKLYRLYASPEIKPTLSFGANAQVNG